MLKDLVLANRSYRGYDSSYQLSKEELTELVDYARLAPSGSNAQVFRYFLAWEKEVVDRILAQTKWAGALPQLNLPYEGTEPTAFIVVVQDLKLEKSIPKRQKDVGVVSLSITLAATEKGLGACMIGNFSARGLKDALHLAEGYMPVLVIALGKPNEKIVLQEIEEGESIQYYRDENNVHYVPKRKLEDILIEPNLIK